MKKIKILVFVEFFYPHKNGVSEYILNIYRKLIDEDKVEVHILTFNNTNSKSYEEYKGFKIHRIKSYSLLNGTYNLPNISSWNKKKKQLKKENFDFVNPHTRFFISSFLGFLFGKFNKIPVVHTEHGAMFVPHPSFIVKTIARIYDETLGRIILTFSEIPIAISKKGIIFANKLGAKKENIKLIHNGISQNFTKTKIENKISKKVTNLCFVGRLHANKGVQDLILALRNMNFEYKLYIIGDGDYKKELEKQVQKESLEENIEFLGLKDRDFIISFLQKMDIFINPSYAEGFPTVVLEAGICKNQVIATNVGGTKEILSNTKEGYLFEPKDISKLRSLLKLANKNKENKTTSLKDKILKNYEWSILSDKLYETLKNYKK